MSSITKQMNAFRLSSLLEHRFANRIYSDTRSKQFRSLSSKRELPVAKKKSKLTTTKHPFIEKGLHLPCRYNEMSNDSLAVLTALEVEEACEELMKRHIMREDKVDYWEAGKTFRIIAEVNREGMFSETIPHGVGAALAVTTGLASFPLVFHEPTVAWFNKQFVTTEVPPLEDLETVFEIGAWSWNWMEPPLGQISFFLLCLQFARSSLGNLGLNNYSRRVKVKRAQRLAERFPQYEPHVLIQYSLSTKYL